MDSLAKTDYEEVEEAVSQIRLLESDQSRVMPNTNRLYLSCKRIFDVTASMAALIVLLPVFIVTALAIKKEDGGPVLFLQERNGLNGKVFHMYKFRSMCVEAPKMHNALLEKNELDGPAFKIKDDPRLTRVGKFIRRTSIDELPQLINIIRGEMSIVGPRPLPVYETELLSGRDRQRLLVKPGLSCYWQCSGRSDISFQEWMELDRKYIREQGVLTDGKIIFRTIGVIFKGGGAY